MVNETLKTKAQLLHKIAAERINKFYESDIKFIEDIVNNIKCGNIIDIRDKNLIKVEQLLFIEEGSLDNITEFITQLSLTNPEIKVVIYKHGYNTPEIKYTKNIDK